MNPIQPTLTFEKLSIGYRQPRKTDKVIAENLSAELRAGELICLLGPNGAGKSTLMRTLAGMQAPMGGIIQLQGRSLATYSTLELAKQLAVVLTERVEVGNLSAYALVGLGRHPYTNWQGRLTADDEAIVQWALTITNSVALASREVSELSDGERQRVMIARALAQQPSLIILDEPTAFLDLPRRVDVMRLLRTLARKTGTAILLSTHDLDLALRSADQVWLLAPGGGFSVGTPEELVLNGAFEAAFQNEGVAFDPVTGSFRLNAAPNQTVTLSGEGLPLIWTARALERVGYQVSIQDGKPKQNSGTPHIHLVDTTHETRWQVYLDESCTEFRALAPVLERLKQVTKIQSL